MELNKAIYNKLIELAKDVFNNYVFCKSGVYTLNDIVKGKTKTGEKIDISNDATKIEYNINIDSFSCTFAASAVFALAVKFEKLAKVGAKNKILFSKSENVGELVATFEVEKKAIESIAACDTSSVCAAYAGVFVDLINNNLVCTNENIVNINRLQSVSILLPSVIDSFWYEKTSYKYGGVVVPLSFIKNAIGKMSIYKDKNEFYITAENGISASCESVFYPNYLSFFKAIDKNSCMIKKNVRTLKKVAAKLAKVNHVYTVSIFGVAGENCITIAAKNYDLNSDNTIKIELQNTLKITFCKDIAIDNIKAINNIANTIYLNSDGYFVFTGTNYISLVNIMDLDSCERVAAGAFAREHATELNCNYNILRDSGFVADANSIVAAAVEVVEDNDSIEVNRINQDANNIVAAAVEVVEDNDSIEVNRINQDANNIVAAAVEVVEDNDSIEVNRINQDANNVVAAAVEVVEDNDSIEVNHINQDANNVVAINNNIASIIAPAKNHQNF